MAEHSTKTLKPLCELDLNNIDEMFTIMGKPTSQKNLKRVAVRNGKSFLYTPGIVKVWQNSAKEQLMAQWNFNEPIPLGVELEAVVFSYLGKNQSIDADNLAGAPMDALQKAGIIKNDYWVKRVISERRKDLESPRVIILLRNYKELEE